MNYVCWIWALMDASTICLNNVGSEAVQGDVEYMFSNHNSLLRNTHSAIKYFSWQSILSLVNILTRLEVDCSGKSPMQNII